MSFSDNIYRLRKTNGMSEEGFAHLFGVSEEDVHAWENGVSYPEKEILFRIANQLRGSSGDKIFQRSFFDHIVRNRDDYYEIYKYIYENPIRWYYDKLYSEE